MPKTDDSHGPAESKRQSLQAAIQEGLQSGHSPRKAEAVMAAAKDRLRISLSKEPGY
jgi:hypothetical protein